VLDPAESMKERKDTKNLTLGEIKKRDEDNLKLLVCKEYRFDSFEKALGFMIEAIRKCMTRMGVKGIDQGAPEPPSYNGGTSKIGGNLYIPGSTKMDIITQQMVENDVRREIRHPAQYPDPKDKWKAGCYLYHGSEIAYFISNPMMDKRRHESAGNIIIAERTPQRFFVRTNAPV